MPPHTLPRSASALFSHVMADHAAEERERALRALLMCPLMPAGDPALELVRRHASYLRDWFGRETGWNLQVERQCARLYKRPAALDDPTRGLPEFDQDRYALLCLACAVLDRAESQITLRTLGERLLEATADPDLEESVRDRWARLGITVNELALPALCLNLPRLDIDGAHLSPGEPVHLLRTLLRRPPPGMWPNATCSSARTPTSSPSPPTA
jgi:Protein of unknown function (DUF2398)